MAKQLRYHPIVMLGVLTFSFLSAFTQVKIASVAGVPNPSAMLDVESSNRGFLPPRIFLTDRLMQLNGINPVEGTIIFSINWGGDGTLGGLFIWKNNQWLRFQDSFKTVISFLKLVKTSNQSLIQGNMGVDFNEIDHVQQPPGDAAMWSTARPSVVIIRRRGWYLISGSCRINDVLPGEPRYISVMKNNVQVTAVGFNNPGGGSTKNNVTLNTSGMVFCEVNDEVTLSCYSINSIGTIAPSGLRTTQLSVTQLPTAFF